MTSTRKMLAVVALVVAGTIPVIGSARADKGHAYLYFVSPSGAVMQMDMPAPLSADKKAMLMQHAHKLPVGAIVYTEDGAVWVADDVKLSDGKMLSDTVMH